DTPPVLTSFGAAEGSGRLWTFWGTVTWDRQLTDLVVYFGGAPVSLTNVTATVNSQGTFQKVVELDGTPSDNGTETAYVLDPWGLVSNTRWTNVHQAGT